MSKRLALVWVLFFLAALAAFAGDVAQFVNLGFSKDARYFMFGQFGLAEKDSIPWADTFIVDVQANAFVSKGIEHIMGTQPADPGANGLGALLKAVAESLPQTKKLGIDHLSTGRLLYVLLDGAQPAETLEFRDFESGRSYKIVLTQTIVAAGASYGLSISITEKNGTKQILLSGEPRLMRSGVKAYHIKQIILSPDGASVVFVVQKEVQDAQGSNIRYMVETARPK
jgi:predicted secreted protein